jgi:hypothetical protein
MADFLESWATETPENAELVAREMLKTECLEARAKTETKSHGSPTPGSVFNRITTKAKSGSHLMTQQTDHDAETRVVFELLLRRFEAMAEVREKHALERRMNRDGESSIAAIESAAQAYRRCAEELRRVIEGDTPPPPNHRWD